MHQWNSIGRHCIALGLIAVGAAHAAVIYKWTDADGVIHYSDQAAPGAERIVTSSSSTGSARPSTPSAGVPARGPQTTSTNKAGPLQYLVFAIDSPAKEQVFFGDDSVPVHLRLDPALKEKQSVAWHLNGSLLSDQTDAMTFTLPRLPRGAYQLSATITDTVSGESQTSDAVTFYVRQPSELAPLRKRP